MRNLWIASNTITRTFTFSPVIKTAVMIALCALSLLACEEPSTSQNPIPQSLQNQSPDPTQQITGTTESPFRSTITQLRFSVRSARFRENPDDDENSSYLTDLIPPRPVVTSVSPNEGPVTGGTRITIIGQNFLPDTTVSIGAIPCTIASPTDITPTQIICTTGQNNSGDLPRSNLALNVYHPDGTRNTGWIHFSYIAPPPPTITSFIPTQAIAFEGGTRLTINGTHFLPNTQVFIDEVACTIAQASDITSTQILCTAGQPRSPGYHRIEVRVPNQPITFSPLHIQFRYPPRPTARPPASLPPPRVTSVTPDRVMSFAGGTQITLAGTNFRPGATVTVGGVPCAIAQEADLTATQIICTTGQPTRSGEARILVRNPDGQLNQTWVYLSYPLPPRSGLPIALPLPNHPGSGTPIPDISTPGRPQPHFLQEYAFSEAEIYRGYLNTRHTTGHEYGANTSVGTDVINVSTYQYDGAGAFIPGYLISEQSLAAQLATALGTAFEPGTVISETQVQTLPQELSDAIVNAIDQPISATNPSAQVTYNNHAFPGPAVLTRPLTPDSEAYLAFIRETIMNRISALNDSQQAQEFTIASAEGGPTVLMRYFRTQNASNGLSLHGNSPHWFWFNAMMEGIATNNETMFIENIVTLATLFNFNLLEARGGFIDAYTYMFVGKQFPSPITRQFYMHFTLRCGGIY